MKYVCIFTHTVYGTSGDELPPPAQTRQTYGYLSAFDESGGQFMERMQLLGIRLRREADAAPIWPYSCRDSWGWQFSEIRVIPGFPDPLAPESLTVQPAEPEIILKERKRCATVAAMFSVKPDRSIHPDIKWNDMSDNAKMVAHTTAQQIAIAIIGDVETVG